MRGTFDIDYSIKLTRSEITAIRNLITDLTIDGQVSPDDYSEDVLYKLQDVAGEFNDALKIIKAMNEAKIKKYNE